MPNKKFNFLGLVKVIFWITSMALLALAIGHLFLATSGSYRRMEDFIIFLFFASATNPKIWNIIINTVFIERD